MSAWSGIQGWQQTASAMQNQLFESALGISRAWYVRGVDFDAARKMLTIGIDFVVLAKTCSDGRLVV
jgi:hypothetical protein